MQPTFKQVPPRSLSFSTSAVLSPSWPARIAATYPPGPEPMITTSNFSIFNGRDASPTRPNFNIPGTLGDPSNLTKNSPCHPELKIERHLLRVLDALFHFYQKRHRFFPVHRAMIVAQRQVHHWP